jgi:hypothetical protein
MKSSRCPLRRRGFLLLLVVALVLSVSPQIAMARDTTVTSGLSPLAVEKRAELRRFTTWLRVNRSKGLIGEVGWPGHHDAAQWNAVADAWYAEADRAGLWVTAWATGEWWGTNYPLTPYQNRNDGAVDAVAPQARVVEAHRSTRAYLRGVNVAGGEFSTGGSFSSANPGRYDWKYHYDSQATFNFLASRGVKLVRIPFRWERLRPRLDRRLHQAELARLQAVVSRARAAGLSVILDMHNYGGYVGPSGTNRLSSRGLRVAFADTWKRISKAFKGTRGVFYGLMNEPHDLPGGARTWELASQSAVRAIRSTGDKSLVLVAGYNWSGAQVWPSTHRRAWITDPLHNIRYEAHHYFDHDHSGTYTWTYNEENAAAARRS